MADMMAIVSKAVFEKAAGKSPEVGTCLRMDRYVSANKALEPLAGNGKLYLVTVRPPDEALWLVAVLDKPKFDGTQWLAKPCATPITDISKLRSKIKFESGVGITAKKGALGMSLQTPRTLTAEDVELLDAAAGGAGDGEDGDAAPAPKARAGKSDGAAAKPAAGKPKLVPPPPAAIQSGSTIKKGLLLDAVFEDPENDDARRVYADQLTTKNDPRGEFILVDIALAGRLSIRKREELVARRKQLFDKNAKTWFKSPLRLRVSRGMVEAITGSLTKILKAAPALFETEPITEVTITGLKEGSIDKLLDAPWLPRVRRLLLRGKPTAEEFATLCASPALANLTTLNVTGCKLEADALGGLDGGLPAVRTLVLTGNEFGDDGVEGLANWKHLGGIQTLYLSSCKLTSDGVEALLGHSLGQLAKLTLTKNKIGDKGIGAIVGNAKNLPALGHLELIQTGISKTGLKALQLAKLPALRRLDVRSNGIATDFDPSDQRVRAGK